MTVSRALALYRANRLLFIFIGLALASRIVFWLYTGRIWEDALITLTPARNAWEGFGLTHHASEPRVHSFTSPLSVLIPLAGEAFGQGLLAIRLVSLAAAAAAIYYAYSIGRLLNFHWSGFIALLGYLAFDHLQIIFGMSGMETQIATAIMLANAYYWLTSQWRHLGVALGLGLICRPEFGFWAPILGISILLTRNYRALIPVVGLSALIFLPWVIFATLYYGSPIPNTIIAKSISFRFGTFLGGGWPAIGNYFLHSWPSFAPFLEFWFVKRVPFPESILLCIVLLVTALVVVGMIEATARRSRMLAIAALLLVFLVYFNGSQVITYYMWYLPPFVALAFLLAGYGISRVARAEPALAGVTGIIVAIAYALPLPFVMPLDRRTQVDVDDAVRTQVGLKLNSLMGPNDTVVLEPLGYIGWAARNKTIYDFPGLGSKIAVAALKNRPSPSPYDLTDALKPTFAVLRPFEFERLRSMFPSTAALYTVVETVKGTTAGTSSISNMGVSYGVADDEFAILRKVGADAPARPVTATPAPQ